MYQNPYNRRHQYQQAQSTIAAEPEQCTEESKGVDKYHIPGRIDISPFIQGGGWTKQYNDDSQLKNVPDDYIGKKL